MGRKPGYHHSEETKARIAASVSKAATGASAPAKELSRHEQEVLTDALTKIDKEAHAKEPPDIHEIARRIAFTLAAGAKVVAAKDALDALDALATGPVTDVLMLMLWVNRHHEPELTMQITDRDLAEFQACVEYLHVTPDVRIVRPQGLPGHDVIPATRTRSAIPAAEPTPPKNYVTVSLVEKNTENAIRPVESTEQGWAAAEEAKNFARARDKALQLAGELQQAAATGNYSSSTLDEAARCLAALAR